MVFILICLHNKCNSYTIKITSYVHFYSRHCVRNIKRNNLAYFCITTWIIVLLGGMWQRSLDCTVCLQNKVRMKNPGMQNNRLIWAYCTKLLKLLASYQPHNTFYFFKIDIFYLNARINVFSMTGLNILPALFLSCLQLWLDVLHRNDVFNISRLLN